jgi:hypothetical protein
VVHTVAARCRGLAPGRFDLLAGIAVAADGRIYVTDANQNVVVSVQDMSGAGWAYFGPLQFDQPTDVVVTSLPTVDVAPDFHGRGGSRVTGLMRLSGWRERRRPRRRSASDPR